MGYIDLHVHSNVSDGKNTVKEIIDMAIMHNVTTLALTEHYNMGSYTEARHLADNKIEIIPAVEIGASLEEFGLSKKHVCHIAAYYPNYSICNILDYYETTRDVCVKKTLRKLKNRIRISYEDVVKYCRNKNSIGRFDIAIALYKKGYAKSPVAAYGQFLELGTAGYIMREKLSATALIEKIRNCNGVPVIVHPKSLKLNFDDTFNLFYKLKDAGLEGIEVFNPNNNEQQRENYISLANYFDFVTTCGSDFHGIRDKEIMIGTGIENNLCISDYSIIKSLKKRQHTILEANTKYSHD